MMYYLICIILCMAMHILDAYMYDLLINHIQQKIKTIGEEVFLANWPIN